jgi:hypothetical protein
MGDNHNLKPNTLKPFVSHFVGFPQNELIKLKMENEFQPLAMKPKRRKHFENRRTVERFCANPGRPQKVSGAQGTHRANRGASFSLLLSF